METMYVNMRQTRLREMMALLYHKLVVVVQKRLAEG